jgi:transcriptional regulator GlxA family with amidase domain
MGETAASGEVGDPRVAAALEVMRHEHGNADLRLDDIARRVRLSKWHLNRLLTRHTGWGFLQHMREIRLSHAERLLAGPKLAIKEIAFSVGYKYVNELDRHFMAKHGMTPSSYRKQCSTAAGLPSPVKSDEIRSASPRE